MFSKELLQECKEKVNSAQRIAVFSHESVDGDAIGSMLSMGTLLESLGKHVGYFTTLPPGKSFSWVAGIEKIATEFDYSDTWDLIFFLDFSGYKRIPGITEGHEEYFNNKYKIVIDHHIEPAPVANLNLSEVDASSNCELIFEIASEIWNELITPQVATYLYLGLVTDTDNFQYEKDSIRTMKNALGLMQKGADKTLIIEKVYHNNPPTILDFLKLTIPRITIDQHVCYVRYTYEECAERGVDKDIADGALNFIKSIYDLPVVAIIRTQGDKVGISLRSGYSKETGAAAERINVQQVATALGGGGHKYAAGCKVSRLEIPLEQQVKQIVDKLNEEITKQL